jgi:regulator of sigma E protease
LFVGLPIGELLLFALGPIVSIALWYLIPLSNKGDLVRNRWISYIPVIVAIVLFVVLRPQGWMLIFPVLGFLIFIHELGHFLTAKWFGITVKEFGFGFPPRMVGLRFKPHGTIYSINWIPLGGFVRMVGEHGEEIEKGTLVGQEGQPDKNVAYVRTSAAEELTTEPQPEVDFGDQSVLKRVIVLSAGSFMNLVFPAVVFTLIFLFPQDTLVGTVVINGVAPGSPAQEAGINRGDMIVAFDGQEIDNQNELIQRIMARLGSPTDITIMRGAFVTGSDEPIILSAKPEVLTIEPRLNPPSLTVVETVTDPDNEVLLADAKKYNFELVLGDEMTQGSVGILIGTTNQRIESRSHSITKAVPMSLGRMRDVVLITKNSLARWGAGGPDPGLAGPVGIANVTGQVAQFGITPLVEFMALISISLGIVNILPIPALDGGRLLFVLIEWVRRGKRISPQREGLVHMIGFVVLISLIALITIKDVRGLLGGDSLLP